MVKDYKNRVTKIKSNPCLKCWSITVFLILVIVIQFYISTPSAQPEQPTINPSALSEDDRKYTFYHTLPNDSEIVIPDDEINTISREKYFGKDKNTKYNIQAGSFKSLNEAVKHQKQLKNIGFKAIIERINFGNTIWNRVKLGPYSITEVKSNKEKLRKHGVDVIVTKIHTDRND